MAYTIIEVEEQTGISSYTLRFWAKKGLFPFIERDKHGVKYFSDKDIEWARWIEWLRKGDMSLEDIKLYVNLFAKGFSTASKRREILKTQHGKVLNHIKELKQMAKMLEHKIAIYDEALERGVDLFNTQSSDYEICGEVHKQ